MDASPAHDPAREGATTAVHGGAPTAARSVARSRNGVPAIGIGATRRCSRAGCGDPAIATLVFSYTERVARVVELVDEPDPQVYDLCGAHADRTSPPRGWELADTRPPRQDAPRRLDDEDTVAVIAAVLRGDDAPRRVDVIEGGEDSVAAPRRVTAHTPHAAPAARAGGSRTPEAPGAGQDPRRDDDESDPLRAALEELQRVVDPDGAPEAAPIPFPRRRRDALPPPPSTPPPGPPSDGPADPSQDGPTLW